VLTGVHVLPGASYANVDAASDGVVKTALYATIGEQWKANHPDGVWIHRGMLVGPDMRDYPTIYEWYNPQIYARASEQSWTRGADYNEFMNESGAPDWDTFVSFTIGVLEWGGDRGYCLLWGSFAAGNPDYPAWADLVRIIEWADEHPCGTDANGNPRYHNLALHQPLYMPPDIARGAWVLEQHIVDRHRLVDELVRGYTGRGLADHPSGGVWFTEYGLHDGYSGSWSDSFSCEEIARSFAYSAERLNETAPFVRGFGYWTFGDAQSIWTDDQACSGEIERAVG